MTLVIILACLFLAVGTLIVFTMPSSAQAKRKAAIERRVRSLRATPEAKAIDPNIDIEARKQKLPKFLMNFRGGKYAKTLLEVNAITDLRILLASGVIGSILLYSVCRGYFRFSLFFCFVLALVTLFGLPWQIFRWRRAGKKAHFLATLPEAVDMVIRAIRAGLPISSAIDGAGREVSDPVGLEFRTLASDLRIGYSFVEALKRSSSRVNLVEYSFFTASLSLQSETGGNLAETLEILSGVLRRRHEMQKKISAMTSEARTSAYVMGSLPFVVGGLLFLINPAYMSKYFTDPRGAYLIGMGLGCLTLGGSIMWLMIQNARR